ncbi:trag protein [Rhodobacteraceae bacterium KLH11]|nr:trag protein [Rhodobacteraceae bacterium KLH11]
MARVTQGNGINFEDIRSKPTSIYFSISGKKVKEYKTLIRLFFLDLINTIETEEPGEDEPFKVLILLDEFQRLGNLERVVEAYDIMRSFGGRLVLISQSISRLQEIYGHEGVRAMLANAGTQMFAAREDPEVREHVSRSIGDNPRIASVSMVNIDKKVRSTVLGGKAAVQRVGQLEKLARSRFLNFTLFHFGPGKPSSTTNRFFRKLGMKIGGKLWHARTLSASVLVRRA